MAKASMPMWGTGIYRPRQGGLTLIEVLTVLLVIGIASAAAVLSLSRPTDRAAAAATQVAAYLDSAAQWAQWHRRAIDVRVIEGRLVAALADGSAPTDAPLDQPMPLDKELTLTVGNGPLHALRFAASGLNEPGELALADGTRQIQLRWDAMNRFSVVRATP